LFLPTSFENPFQTRNTGSSFVNYGNNKSNPSTYEHNKTQHNTPSTIMTRLLAATAMAIVTVASSRPDTRHESLRTGRASGVQATTTLPRQLIVNGEAADHADFPYFALSADHMTCGASLIHPDILVSAAHCQGAFHDGLIMIDEDRLGFNRTVRIDAQFRHKDFDLYFRRHGYAFWDIMVMKLSEPIYDIPPIAWNSDDAVPAIGDVLTLIGYGVTEYEGDLPDRLLQADFVYIDNDMCRLKVQEAIVDDVDDVDSETAEWYAEFMIGDDSLCVDPTEEGQSSSCNVSSL
jgi:Trypsin